jgi:hypothetical protein
MKVCLFYFFISFFLTANFPQDFKKVGLDMTKRINSHGVTQTVEAKVFYSSDGKMVTYYPSPNELYVINNAEGELKIYNPKKNEVFQRVNYALSSENSHLYYFFQNKSDDMGLNKLGFKLSKSEVKDGLLVSIWTAPMQMQKSFSKIELVHKDSRPIFLGYKDRKERFLKKVYFYDYTDIFDFSIPQSITEIDYVEKDSVISKTTFSNFIVEGSSLDRHINFAVPSNAKLIE